MKKRISSFFGTMAAVMFAALLLSSPTWAQITAYDATVQPGNQSYTGNLGLDFHVNSQIVVSSLGAFDSNGDGFAGTVQVAIFKKLTMAIVAGPLSFTGTNGTLIHGDRFRPLASPVTLAAGDYSVVAVGFSASDLNGNAGCVGNAAATCFGGNAFTLSTENDGGAISFIGTGRFDGNTSLDYPANVDVGPTNRYLAGTFQFVAVNAQAESFLPPGTDVFAMGVRYPEAVAVDKFNTPNVSLAVVNYGSNNVSILLGDGLGGFPTATNYLVGMNPRAVAVGNFRGTNKRDLVVANVGDNTVSILLATGGGAFAPAVPYYAGPSPYSVAVADFNNDGNLDIVVANDNLGLSVLLGNGDGTFQPPITTTDPSVAPASVVVGDFNGDPNLDVAVANPMLGTVSVLLGQGDGTFLPFFSSSPLPRPMFITAGKFKESSGFTDVAVADAGGNVYVLTGNGDGTLNAPVAYPVGRVPNSLAVGDLNGDGHLDLLVANSYSSNVGVLVGKGDGTFQTAVNFTTPSMWIPTSVGLGIFETTGGSKRLDAAVVDFYGPVHILLGKKFTITHSANPSISGNGQFAAPGTAFARPLVATVSPAVAGIPVTFTAPGSGASATFAGGTNTITVLTDGTGTATSPTFTANATPGLNYKITATVGYAGSPSVDPNGTTTFTESN